MKIVLLYNPRSGGSRREAEVGRLRAALAGDAHEIVLVRAGAPEGPTLRDALHDAGALVIVGGDGTVHHALPDAARTGVPIYHWPTGTENLFARHFGTARSETALRRSLAAARVEAIDLGDVDGRLFALMCSVGPDAAVAHRLNRERKGSISRATYLPHICRELRERPPALKVWVDGVQHVDGRRGMCVVANAAEYGARLGPAINASMSDGLLDMVFLPAETSLGSLWWLLRARLGRHLRDPRLIYRTGRDVVIANAGEAPAFVQCDGEAAATLAPGSGAESALQIVVRERAARVLTAG